MDEHVFDFRGQMKMSHGVSDSFDFKAVLLHEIPSAIAVRRASDQEDRTGTDWWVDRQHNKPLSIDLKARGVDYSVRGEDDLALETWSVLEREVVGWTRDPAKGSDYILWFWKDTRRWCMIPFPMLCRVFGLRWEEWKGEYRTSTQRTRFGDYTYHSECVFVPREIVWAALIEEYSPPVSVVCASPSRRMGQ